MQLKKIKRAEKKGSESVVDEKFSLFFSSKFLVGGEIEYQVSGTEGHIDTRSSLYKIFGNRVFTRAMLVGMDLITTGYGYRARKSRTSRLGHYNVG